MTTKARNYQSDDRIAALITTIREALARVDRDRHATECTPIDRATAEARFEALLASEAAAVGPGVDASAFTLPVFTVPARGVLVIADPQALAVDPIPHLVGATLARFCGPLLRATFREAADLFYAQHPEALDDDTRTARLAELDAERLCLECDEERAIREAEGAGVAPVRRSDASPTVVLAPDEEIAGNVPIANVDLARYWSICDRRDALADALYGADERRRIARDELQRATVRLHEAEQTAASRRVGVPDELRQFEAQRKAAFERLSRTYDETHERWGEAVRLAEACCEYAVAQGCDVREPGSGGIEPGGMSAVMVSQRAPQWDGR